jgi:hypothetical protein
MLIIEQGVVVDLGLLEVGANSVGDRKDFIHIRLTLMSLKFGVSLAQRFRHHMRKTFAGGVGYGLREPECLCILDIETQAGLHQYT